MVQDRHLDRRLTMVRRQIEGRGVRDPRVLDAMRTVPRHRFVSRTLSGDAYKDHPLPIGSGQTISQPYIVALMAEAAAIEPDNRVLEVGTGSGYGAAVLAELAASVVSVERHRKLANSAAQVLAELGYDNATVVCADGSQGHLPGAPYDAVVVTAAAPSVPSALIDQLVDGGRMVIPVGPATFSQNLTLVRREGDETTTERFCPVRFVPLVEES
ncbi:MAG: protein-L-isoaspartate(D-aspartate) O-methyltransferase [bacterium]|nr:protein-L-isoaspartate(D-aspartate) O-methyltransferase [bacterium]MXZ85611.1 protein-L-isoaspartate(D-aspartate) O-methyltransferase [Acidimicrobiia bacterium]MYG72989.1 protein-L-isoaspartate(D-aspartate) O-methyltransferase [Acidimicrobiia bacterium]MYH97315.1 protein-L-isoaspartate(D-aspartate) O-methyltransferase [Acidimicrobiia bacterium]MYL08276.1 protein-L-isoaspartate(D-aspartate) O-methyltransferase [Acidimicrobiia bacterium]